MNTSQVFKVSGIVFGATLLMVSSGCESKKHASKPDNDLQSIARNDTYTPPATVATAPSTSSGLRGPRTQAELDQLYNRPAAPLNSSAPAVRPVASAPAAVRYPDEGIVADPAWNVQISREWRHIVIHHSASNVGSAAIFDKAHKERGWDGLGYHFVIGNGSASGNGEVEVGYRWKNQMQGAHAGNAEYNQAGIGICLVGDFEHGGRPTAEQMVSLRRLVRFLQAKTGVPAYEVIGHGNVPGRNTDCPGKSLDLAAFRESLGGGAPIQYTRPSNPAPSPASSNSRLARTTSSSRGGAGL